MDEIVQAILKLQLFVPFFKWLGCNEGWSEFFSVIVSVLLVTGLVKIINTLLKHRKYCKAALEDIKPQFDYLAIKKARRYYIQTQYQNASPAREEEPGFTHKYIARNKLIPFFTKIAFNEKVDSERFYLILADSGMGKTTFMINLYLKYNSFWSYRRECDIKLFRFSIPDTINQIKAIKTEDAKRTILLLDALDEDRGIISTDPALSDAKAFQNRIEEIINLTINFREVVITCRTQYFPGQEEDPYELTIKRPDGKGFYLLNKLYISPFNEKEVKSYLNKKFGIIPFVNRENKKRALEIVSRSENLLMRPMLLSYIDYLIEAEVKKITTYTIYDKLVAKWLLREAEKRKGLADRGKFMDSLRQLSYKTAIAIYLNWRKEGRMYVTKEEALKIAEQFDIHLKPEEITGQSLLTCDGVGNWKFAHKSILEFFLANEAYYRPVFLKEMRFKGMEMARKFYEELDPRLIIFNQYYMYASPVSENEFNKVMAGERNVINGIIFNFDDGVFSLKRYYLNNAVVFCDKMNKEYEYLPVYSGKVDFLNIGNVRGFRLPTRVELRNFYMNKAELFFRSATIQGLGESISKAWYEMKNTGKYYSSEWCHDEKGISVIHFLYTSDGHVVEIADMPSAPANSGMSQGVSEQMPRFRLVFVP